MFLFLLPLCTHLHPHRYLFMSLRWRKAHAIVSLGSLRACIALKIGRSQRIRRIRLRTCRYCHCRIIAHTHTTDSQKLSRRWGLSIGIFVTCAQTVARAGINDRLSTPFVVAAAAVVAAADHLSKGEISWVRQAVSLLYIRS